MPGHRRPAILDVLYDPIPSDVLLSGYTKGSKLRVPARSPRASLDLAELSQAHVPALAVQQLDRDPIPVDFDDLELGAFMHLGQKLVGIAGAAIHLYYGGEDYPVLDALLLFDLVGQ